MPKILIVEDDQVLVKMYSNKFTSEGFDVSTAYSGTEGLALALNEKPDAILLDIMMPGMDGFQVIRELKKDEITKAIPIVIFTNLGASDVFIQEAKNLGVNTYLVKYKTSVKDVVEAVRAELRSAV